MANSPYQDTVFLLDVLTALGPRSVLDVGSGFGRWGFLCRCHIATGESVRQAPVQALTIDAVEAFGANVNPTYDAVYNRVFRGDISELAEELDEYDVVICSHVIEHFEKPKAIQILAQLRKLSKMAVLVGVPLGDDLRGEVSGNPYEAHKSVWTRAELVAMGGYVRQFKFLPHRWTAAVVFPSSLDARWVARNQTCMFWRLAHRVRHLLRSTGKRSGGKAAKQ